MRDDETDAARRFDSDPDNHDSEYIKDVRSAWARLINKVYEVDPLICPHCGGEMRFLAVIKEFTGSFFLRSFSWNRSVTDVQLRTFAMYRCQSESKASAVPFSFT